MGEVRRGWKMSPLCCHPPLTPPIKGGERKGGLTKELSTPIIINDNCSVWDGNTKIFLDKKDKGSPFYMRLLSFGRMSPRKVSAFSAEKISLQTLLSLIPPFLGD